MAGKRNINGKIINDSNTVQKFTRDVLWVASSQVLLVLAGMIVIPALTKSFGSGITYHYLMNLYATSLLSRRIYNF